jgi:TonB family protein
MKPIFVAAIVVAAVSAPIAVTAQKQDSPYDRDATWLRQPSAAEVLAVRPTAAIKEGLDGRALLKCLVTVQGALTNCSVVSENPPGKGFGGAALTLTSRFEMRPATKNGRPVESWVQFPVNMSGLGGRPTDSFIRGQSTAGMNMVLRTAAWTRLPSFEEMAAAYPAKAKAAGKTGRATIHCHFKKDGTLTSCSTLAEEPAGQGFSAAARQLANSFQAALDTMPNLPPYQNLSIDVPFTFDRDLLENKRRPMTRPVWISQPGEDAMRVAFPARALASDIGKAKVVLACVVGPQGGLADCRVSSEEPKALGFGEAGLALSRMYQVRRWSDEGLPTTGQPINIAVGYDLGPPELAEMKARRGGARGGN